MKKILGFCVISGVLLVGCNNGKTEQIPTPTQEIINQDTTQANDHANQDYTSQLQELEKKVTETTKKAEGLQATGNLDADYQTGTDMLMELKALSNEIDVLEDKIEYQARNGNISDYLGSLEKLDALDQALDLAEDFVEYTFYLED